MRRVLLVLLAILIVLAAYLGVQAYHIYTGINSITDKTVARATGEPTEIVPSLGDGRRINFLLLGSDNDQKKEEAAPLTQSMIVVTVDPVNDRVGVLSIPRDFWVNIPGHGYAKIDLAFKYGYQHGGMAGGVRLARLTVEKLFGIPIDYYGWVGLSGFARVIDTFGGVTLDVQHPILDDTYPNDISSPDPYGSRRLFIPAGWQHMDGQSALEYVRSRHGDVHGDFNRSQRQQQVLLQIRQKINTLNVLTNLPSLISDLENSVQTDLTLQQLYEVDRLSHRIPKSGIQRMVLQAPTYCYATFSSDGQYILQPYWKRIRPIIKEMFAPVHKTATGGRPPTPAVRSATVTATPGSAASPGATRTPTPTVVPTQAPQPLNRAPGAVVYVSDTFRAAQGDIYETTPDGRTIQLTYSHDAAMPSLSPDGRTLAFVRFTNGLHKYDKYASDIWVMDLATRKQHVITQDESPVAANNLWAAYPSWSSDGRLLVYATDRQKLSTPPSDARDTNLAIWSISAEGSNPVQLTVPSQMQSPGGDADPAFRPHTKQFVFVRWAYPSASSGNPGSQLILEDAVSHAAYGLTALSGSNSSYVQPAWSPDGRRLVYLQRSGSVDQLIVASVRDVKGRSEITSTRTFAVGKLAQPAFSPDGRWVSYLQADGDTFTLYLRSVANGSLRTISGVQGSLDARWRPVWTR